MKVSLGSMPGQHKTNIVDFTRLDGGLNLWELDYRLDRNQSSEMKNLWWQDGVLQCRDGQVYVYKPESDLGTGYTCFSETFWDYVFMHVGDKLYAAELSTLSSDEGATPHVLELCSGVPENRGTFFRYGDHLYYKNRGGFIKIAYSADAETPFTASDLADDAHVPVIVINAHPETGSGTTYQPENRLSPRKTVWYNAVKDVKEYKLPASDIDSIVSVEVDGAAVTAYTADLSAGKITFDTAPPVTEPATNNTVVVTYSKSNADAYNAIMDCPYAVVYGGDQNVCMVLGGCTAQPNAFFWNGNDELSMDPTYWPMSFYNLAGDTEDTIMGFGKQYGELIIFKGRSVGKATYGVERVDGRDSISLTYTNINSRVGCDLPWTIQLVDNNLVFCNSSQGVHVVRDSSAAYENNIECLSRNVNGTAQRVGLLDDLRRADANSVCSFDDDNRYWLCVGGVAYVWDYVLSRWNNASWFYFTGVHGVAYLRDANRSYHMDAAGRLTQFTRCFADYNGAIEKVYRFPAQFFDSYDRLKDILYVIFTVRSDTDATVKIEYETDYETRLDQTDIRSASWRLSPRNLSYRCLSVQKFAHVARRKPGCRHIRHFSMRLYNNEAAQDLSIVSAQIYFRYLGRDR